MMCRASISMLAVLVAVAPAARAQAVSEDRVRELVGLALSQAATPVAPSGTPAAVATTLDLSLDEALALALEQNLDIAVERLSPETFDLSIASIRAAYKPLFTSTIGQNAQTQLPTNQLVGGARVKNDIGTYNVGISQALPRWGGSYSIGWNNRRQDSDSSFITFNPQFNTTFNASLVQPLLRGFRIDTTRQQLLVTQISRQTSEVQLRGTIVNTLAEVRFAYFDLLYARDALDVTRRSLDLAMKLVEDNKVRVEVGAMAPIDIVQAEAEAATRRQSLAQAEAAWQTAQLALKRLIVSGTNDPRWGAVLNPTTLPTVAESAVDIEAAVRRALNERTDLLNARSQLEANTVTMNLFQNQRLPSADMVMSYGLQGIGGTRLIRQGGLGSTVTESVPGGFRDALDLLWNRDYPNWQVQLQLSYPLGGSSADAQYARARVQVNQAQAQIRALELQAATEVTNAGLQVRSNWRRVEASRAAREFAQRRLEAEQSKFEVGMSTNFFVVQAQRDLADAENTELRALLDYARSTVDFDRLQQTSQSRGTVTTVTGTGGGSGGTGGSSAGGATGGTTRSTGGGGGP
jgi:outer membrane protein TolC